MRYDWEDDIPSEAMSAAAYAGQEEAGEGLVVIGVVWGNLETGEACVQRIPDVGDDHWLSQADWWQDAAGDAIAIYNGILEKMRDDWEKKRRPRR